MKRTWKQIGSLFMAVCMVLTMLPLTAFAETGGPDSGASDSGAPLGASGIITAFAELDAKVSKQTVIVGTPEDELNLPVTLAVTVAESVHTVTTDSGITLQDSQTTLAVAGQTAEPDKLEQAPVELDKPEQAPAEPKTMEMDIQVPVDWVSSPDYDGEKVGTYIFTAKISGFMISATTPSIMVTVVGEATGVVTAFEELTDEIRWQNTAKPAFPETVGGTVEGEAVQIPVTWQTEQDYDENVPERGFYVFDAVPGEGFTLAGGLDAPRITLYIPETVNRFVSFRMGGGGTVASPLEITTADQLAEIAELVNEGRLESFLFNDENAKVSLKLMNDIDLSSYGQGYNEGYGWVPIGRYEFHEYAFKGSFDGDGHTITGLYINNTALGHTGLFGIITSGEINNLALTEVNIRGMDCVGGIAGSIKSNSSITACEVSGKVSGNSNVGGIVGTTDDMNLSASALDRCFFEGTVKGSGSCIGGLVGNAINVAITTSYAFASVSGDEEVGVLVGSLSGSTSRVQNCYTAGDSKGKQYIGGLVGRVLAGAVITDCAALASAVQATIGYSGRVTGENIPLFSGTLTDNAAFSGMKVTVNSSPKDITNDAASIDGKDMTAAGIKADGTIDGRFTTANGWSVENGKLPGFGASVDMPEYITSGNNSNFHGTGVAANPFIISTAEQLAKMAELVNNPATNATYGGTDIHYKLTADIDLSDYGASFNDDKGWVPIGTGPYYAFRGDFNGGGKTITGLYINDSDFINAGLFGDSAGSIHDLHLEAVCVTAEEKVGGIAGRLSGAGARIERCSVRGTITGKYDVGGIAGFIEGTMTNCFSACDVTGQWQVGGVVGDIQNGGGTTDPDILSCYAIGTVIGTSGNIGGVAGSNIGKVRNCAALNPKVSGSYGVGRVVGRNYSTLSGNIAFSGMVGGGSSGFEAGLNGDDTSADALQSIDGFPSGFTTDPWTYASGSLPGLFGKPVEMPTHITAKLTNYFAGGDGTQGNSYLISTAAQLAKLAELVNDPVTNAQFGGKDVYYKLTDNLDLSSYGADNTDFNGGKGWLPIGDCPPGGSTHFGGTFDGNYYTITGLYINDSTKIRRGLFGYIYDGTVQNLGLKNVNITGGESVGGIAGIMSGKLENCYVSGKIYGTWFVGGIAGSVHGSLQNCYSAGSVAGTQYVGGIVGAAYSSLKNCYSTASVIISAYYAGGIAGIIYGTGTIKNCAALNPKVSASAVVGRVAGSVNSGGTLSGNRAFSGMIGGGSAKTADGTDGADISAEEINTAAFWTTAANWDSTATWDNLAWNFQYGYLPLLKQFGPGAQSGDGGLYLTERNIANAMVNTGGPYTYTGSAIEPDLTVTFEGVTLVKDTDYTVNITSEDNAGTGTSAGTNTGTVTLTITGKGNYKGTKTGVSFTIGKKAPTAADLTYDNTAKTYNGLVQPLSVTAKTAGLGTITVKYDESTTEPKDAKTYAVTVSIAEAANYSATTTDISLGNYIIDKAPLTITGGTIEAKTYDGTSAVNVTTVDFDGLQNGETLTFGSDYTVTNTQFDNADAGTGKTVSGTIEFSTVKANNYSLTSNSLSLAGQTISKAAAPSGVSQTIEVLTNSVANYDLDLTKLLPDVGNGKSLGALTYAPLITDDTDTVLGTLDYTSGDTLTIPVNSVSVAGKTVIITVTIKSTNYTDFAASITVKTIDAIPLSISGLTVKSKVYDGTNVATLQGVAHLLTDNVKPNDEVTLAGTATATFDNANAGTDKAVTISGLSLVGKDAVKYRLELQTLTGTITTKQLLWISGSVHDKVYDGSTTATVNTSPGLDGVINNDAVTVKTGTVAFADKNVGGAKDIISSGWGIEGADVDNYTISQPVFNPVSITKKAITITPDSSQSKVYGKANPTLTYTVSPVLFTGDSFTGALSRTSGEEVGDYAITLGTLSAGSNYTLSLSPTTVNFAITAKEVNSLTIELSPSSYIYDGSEKMPTVTVKDGATIIPTGEYTVSYSDNINVGDATVTIAAKVDGNYTFSGITTKNFTITKAQQTGLNITSEPSGAITYNDTFTLSTTGGNGTGAVTWKVTAGSTFATVNTSTGEVSITGVGTVTITATKNGGKNYEDATAIYSFTSEKATPNVGTVSYNSSDVIYTTTAVAAVSDKLQKNGSTTGKLSLAMGTVFTAGTKDYTWNFTPTDSSNYHTATGTIQLKVTADSLSNIIVTTAPTKKTYVYGDTFDPTGMVVTATYASGGTKTLNSNDYTIGYTNGGSHFAVGETSVTLSYIDSGINKNCYVTGLTVNKATVKSISTIISDVNKTAYETRNATTAQAVVNDADLPAYVNITTDNGSTATLPITWSTTTSYNAKGTTYHVIGTLTGNANIDVGSVTKSVSITVTPITAVNPSFGDKTVPFNSHSGSATASALETANILQISGSISVQGEDISYTISWSGGPLDTTADGNSTTFTGTISYPNAPAWLTLPSNFTVSRRVTVTVKTAVTISGISMPNKTYNGIAYVPNGTVSVSGGSVSVSELVWKYESTDSGSYNSVAAPTNAGAYKLTISVPDSNANYIGSEVYTFIIEKRQITLTADNKSVIKGSTLPELTYTVGNLAPGKMKADALNTEPMLACPAFDGNAVGSYPITLTGGTATDNYTIATRTDGALTVAEQTYTVTFNPNGGTRTGGGDLTQTIFNGSAATAPTLSRSNHTFISWDKPFDNVTSNLTITANWRYDGSGSGSGGGGGGSSSGGGGGGGGGYIQELPKPVIPTDKQPNMPTVAKQNVPGTVKDGILSATITEQMVKDAIKAAQDTAKISGKEIDGIALDFDVTGSGNFTNLKITIDAGDIDRLKESGVKFVRIGSAVLDVTLDTGAIAEIDKQSTGTVTVSAARRTKLSGAAKKFIGNRPVFDITVSYQENGKTEYVANFGKGAVTLGIAYKPANKEKSGNLFGVYVDKKGKPLLLTNSSYENGRVIFSRNSLSTYGVGYMASAPAFTDTAKHWAKDNIAFVASHDLISGKTASTFAPDTAILRADFIMALGRLSGADMSIYKTSSFTDVKDSNTAMPYIEWAVKSKIVQGIGSGKFGPNDLITREQMAVMMQNYVKANGYKLPTSIAAVTFSDTAKISAYAKDAVIAIQQAGIMQGKGGNTFDPQGYATRGEAATILRKFIELVIDEGTARGWVQNDAGQWQYIDEISVKPVTGWLNVENGKYHYYFDNNGIMVSGKWLEIDGKWYYFYTDGSLAKNTEIDEYEVDENGVRKNK